MKFPEFPIAIKPFKFFALILILSNGLGFGAFSVKKPIGWLISKLKKRAKPKPLMPSIKPSVLKGPVLPFVKRKKLFALLAD